MRCRRVWVICRQCCWVAALACWPSVDRWRSRSWDTRCLIAKTTSPQEDLQMLYNDTKWGCWNRLNNWVWLCWTCYRPKKMESRFSAFPTHNCIYNFSPSMGDPIRMWWKISELFWWNGSKQQWLRQHFGSTSVKLWNPLVMRAGFLQQGLHSTALWSVRESLDRQQFISFCLVRPVESCTPSPGPPIQFWLKAELLRDPSN